MTETRPKQTPGRNFPSWIEACVESIPEKIIPERYRRWAAISAVSGALGRRCVYDWGPYNVYPQQYIILVGPPSTGKTAAMILPYTDVFKKLAVPAGAFEPKEDNTKHDGFGWNWNWMEYELENPLRWMEGKATTEQLILDLQQAEIQDHALSSMDVTVTRAEMSLKTDEFGEFANRNDNWQSRFMTTVWDGHPSSYRTKHQGKFYVESPAINWIAGATPEEFVKHMPSEALEQGWMSRLLLIWHEGKPIEQKLKYKSPDERTLTHLRSDFAQIAKIRGEYKFESEELFEEVNDWVKAGLPPKPTDSKLERYTERRPAHFIKLLMAVTASRHNETIFTRDDYLQARSYLAEAEEDMPRALQFFGTSDMGRTSLELAHMVQLVFQTEKRGMTLKELHSHVMTRARNPGDVTGLVKAMEQAGLIQVNELTGKVYPPGPRKDQSDTSSIREETKAPDQEPELSPEAAMQAKIP